MLLTDKRSEFKGSCKILIKKYNIKIQKTNSKHTISIVKRFNQILTENLFWIQDAHELLLLLTKRSRAWIKNLLIIINYLNNSITQLIEIISNEAIKKNLYLLI